MTLSLTMHTMHKSYYKLFTSYFSSKICLKVLLPVVVTFLCFALAKELLDTWSEEVELENNPEDEEVDNTSRD